jgi:hypothetical protein
VRTEGKMALVKQLDTIAALENKEDKKTKYIKLVQDIFASESESQVIAFVEHSRHFLMLFHLFSSYQAKCCCE